MEDIKINPVGHVILRRTFSEVDRRRPLFESSSSVGWCLGCSKSSCKKAPIRFLEQRIRDCELQLQKSSDKIEDLTARLAGKLESEAATNPFLSLLYYIFHDIVRNHSRPKNGRRYSPATLRWAWSVHEASPKAWSIIRKGLHLPCDALLRIHFARTEVVLWEGLVDREGVGELVAQWNASHPDTVNDRRVVLSVDAVSFRPSVTIADNGSVEGLEDIRQLESPDLFEQYLLSPKVFTAFMTAWHWKGRFSAQVLSNLT
jgi:hypothetical protein